MYKTSVVLLYCVLGDVEFLLGLSAYHSTVVCSRETTVMSLYKSHYDRLFKRRHPASIKTMAKTLELQLTRRILKPNIIDSVPLLKCFVYRLQEIIKDSGRKIQIASSNNEVHSPMDIVGVTYEDVGETKSQEVSQRMRSYTWSESFDEVESTEGQFRPKPLRFASKHLPSMEYTKPSISRFTSSLRSTPIGRSPVKRSHIDPNNVPGSPDSNPSLSVDTYKTFGSGFRSIGGKMVASSYDRGQCKLLQGKPELGVDLTLGHRYVKHKGDLTLQPILSYHNP